jgi:hypothetical protein
MSVPAAIAMLGWIPLVVLALFVLPAGIRRAALDRASVAGMDVSAGRRACRIQGLPDYTKMSATCGVVLLGDRDLRFPPPHLLSGRAWRTSPWRCSASPRRFPR